MSGRLLRVTVERPHTRPFEALVLDVPNSTQVREAIRRSPHGLARWVLARDRIFLATADILHSELVAVPNALGLVYSTDGGLWWDEARGGFQLYVNDPERESLISTEPAFWRMVRPYRVYVIPPRYRHHLDAPEDAWIELRPDTPPERTSRRDARREEAAARAWEEHGAARLRALLADLPGDGGGNYGGNYAANLRGKAEEALAAGTPTIWSDGDRLRSGRVDWRCDPAGSFAHVGERKVAVTWSDSVTRHPLHREAVTDHFRVVHLAESWEDGEALDPVDRILVEAEICGMMASDGIETVPPASLPGRKALAERRRDGEPRAGTEGGPGAR